ncbi:MAG: VWA domain-containing protein [Bryobacteraceae bacterium]
MKRYFALLVLAVTCCHAQEVVFRTEARLVEVYATVRDDRGKYLDDLARDRFVVSEDGRRQDVVAFQSEAAGLDCAVLLDTTGSLQEELPRVKNAVARFIDELRDEDSVAIYSFTTSVDLLQDFTKDRTLAKRAVMRTRAAGATALFDAIAQVTRVLGERRGKRAAVVFTDGDDNSSVLRARAAIDRAKRAGVPIYMVAQGAALTKKSLLKGMKEIAAGTGGAVYEAHRPGDVAGIFRDIVGDLEHTYLLAYRPPQGDRVRWRSIQLAITGLKNYKVRAREGYFPD